MIRRFPCARPGSKQNGNDALAYNLLGQVYAGQKDYKKAEAALTKAVELQPNSLSPFAIWPNSM